ncbi:MAG: amino acid ABC transporter permease [Clostridium sp.]
MNLDYKFIIDNIPMFIDGLAITVKLGFLGIIISFIVGIVTSIIIYFKVPILRNIASGYIEIARNTPLLLQLFFLYYGLTKLGITLSGFSCGVIGLGFLGGGYMAESIRGGLETVSKSQIESGLSLGLSGFKIFLYIVFPQGFSVSVPSLGANCLFLLKETSVVGAIAVADVMFVAKDLIGMYYKTSEALLVLVICYLIILLPMSILIRFIERRSRYGQYGV